ncbi:MAG: tRNA (adenosine(37)-N6)-threonylcarbamoyltransferase complex dimerization subunit type 1 TsaB [Candidatus Omnitrophica bacterium]|nr:tRNA (adenosine(37)-N6)-threonylcarbamoyltransferase complex dimerization subunit type 1 TsaB [Candidatus Omnitrophota bacterium]
MKILGIDTTTKFLSIGLYDGRRIYEYNLDLGTRHSTLLIPTLKRVLDALGWDVKEIDYFACGLGPGSFTGIRVGAAAVKGLSWPLNKPVAGISTLDILANKVKLPGVSIAPVIDAKRGLIYCSIYKREKGCLKRIAPYMLLSEEELCRKLKRNTVILGDALNLCKEKIIKNISGAVILDKDCWYPDGHNIIYLALEKIRGKSFSSAFNLKPIYLYPKECQIRKH